MTVQSQSADWSAVEEAFEALQPFYGPGDDGDGIRLALDAIAGVLSDATKRELEGDEPLAALLEELKAAKDLIEMVEDLYATAEAGSYGDGMSREDAKKVNDLVQVIEEPLREFLEKKKRARRKRANLTQRKQAKRK